MTELIDLTHADQLDPDGIVSFLLMQSRIPRQVAELDDLCIRTASGEIEFMNENEIDELHLLRRIS